MKKFNFKNLDHLNLRLFLIVILVLFLAGPSVYELNQARAQSSGLCEAEIDVVLALDRSGSMEEGGQESLCVWYQLEWKGPSKQWVRYEESNVDEQWCREKDTEYRPAEYTFEQENKIIAAKKAAGNFLDLLGGEDQSGLVYFSYQKNSDWSAKLEKQLSFDHGSTKESLDSLEAEGPTNIGEAIALAIQELGSSRANLQANKVVILLTDGKANKPYGDGSGEDPRDVEYALEKSSQAASAGIKVFTIGLGSNGEINKNMLQQIADNTQAEYYPSPTPNDLENIYNKISTRLCKYGSISGCKFNDLNQNGSKDEKEAWIEGWEIVLENNSFTATQTTDSLGCYKFSGLPAGIYLVKENLVPGWEQTYPLNGKHQIVLTQDFIDKEKIKEEINFGNYQLGLGGEIEICKYEDFDGLASTTQDRAEAVNQIWSFNLERTDVSTSSQTLSTEQEEYCLSFTNLETGEYKITEEALPGWSPLIPKNGETTTTLEAGGYQKIDFINHQGAALSGRKYIDLDGLATTSEDRYLAETPWQINLYSEDKPGELIATTSTDSSGYYEFIGLKAGNYLLLESLPLNWIMLEGPEEAISLTAGEVKNGLDFLNYYEGEPAGSLKIKKYEDQDGQASTSEDKLLSASLNWKFEIIPQFGSGSSTLVSTLDGEILVENLSPGQYLVKEKSKNNWQAISPVSGEKIVEVGSGQESLAEFVNYYSDSGGGNGNGEKAVCGNGALEPGEECDDGNIVSGDGCSSNCRIEETESGGGGSGGTPVWIFQAGKKDTGTPEEPPEEPAISTSAPESLVPILGISKTVSASFANPGDKADYTVKVVNEGAGEALGVVLVDKLPPGFVYESSQEDTYSWSLGDLSPGEEEKIEYSVVIGKEVEAGIYHNLSKASARNHKAVTAKTPLEIKKVEVKGEKLAPSGFSSQEGLFLIVLMVLLLGGARVARTYVRI